MQITSREVLKKLKEDGWFEVNCVGSHHQYKHPTKSGKLRRQSSSIQTPYQVWQGHRKTSL